MYYVYAIRSINTKYIYIGLTSDIEDRYYRHNSGYERTTKFYAPFKLIFLITTQNRKEARDLEIYFKSGVGREFLKSL